MDPDLLDTLSIYKVARLFGVPRRQVQEWYDERETTGFPECHAWRQDGALFWTRRSLTEWDRNRQQISA